MGHFRFFSEPQDLQSIICLAILRTQYGTNAGYQWSVESSSPTRIQTQRKAKRCPLPSSPSTTPATAAPTPAATAAHAGSATRTAGSGAAPTTASSAEPAGIA